MSEEIKNQEETGNKLVERDEKGRILPGSALNPHGRPAGSYSLLTILKQKLKEIHPSQKKEYGELLIESMLDDALMLDGPSRKLVMQYIEGLPQQKIDLTHNIPQPIYGGKSQETIQVSGHNSDQEDIQSEEEN